MADSANNAPAGSSSSKGGTRAQPTPETTNPGLVRVQDFPSLPTPTKGSLPATVLLQMPHKTTASKANASNLQPAVPKTMPAPNPRLSAQIEAQAGNQASERSGAAAFKSNEKVPQALRKDQDKQRTNGEADGDSKTMNAGDRVTARASEKRQRPGKIDTRAAKDVTNTGLESATETTKNVESYSQPATPATAASNTTASPAAGSRPPKATRMGSTPSKNETSSNVFSALSGNISTSAESKQASRRPSFTSTQQPGTPLSERISDNASLASTSLSRANSPPPSRVGTAPVRVVSKAQQKKERQARAKHADEARVEQALAKAEEPVIMQEPILGRKKKTKKAKQGTADSTPAPTRPNSPERKATTAGEGKAESMPTIPSKIIKKGVSKATPETRKSGEPDQPAAPASEESQKHTTVAALFASLLTSQELNPSATDLFRSFTGINTRLESTADLIASRNPPLSDANIRELDAGAAVRLEDSNGRSTIVLPGGRLLRGLSSTQAQRFLDLVEKNGLPPLNSELSNLLPLLRLPSSAAAIGSSAPQSQDSKLLVNRFATDAHNTSGVMLVPVLHQPAPAVQSVEEAEGRLLGHKRETEAIEKKLNALIKRNRRLILGGGH